MKESVYYGHLLTEKVPYGNVSTIESNYYDRWTGKLKQRGEAFNSIRKYSNGKLCYKESKHRHDDVINSLILFLNWNSNRIVEIRQLSFSKEVLTKFEFNNANLLEREYQYRIVDGKELISNGFRHEYINLDGQYLLDKIYSFNKLPNGTYFEYIEKEYKYDRHQRLSEVYLRGKYDDLGRTIRNSYNYLENNEVIEVSKRYLDENEDHGKYYIRIVEGCEFIVPTHEIALEIRLNENGDLTRKGSYFTYDFDSQNNWIRKYEDQRLIEERRLFYHK